MKPIPEVQIERFDYPKSLTAAFLCASIHVDIPAFYRK
jgi:hypothetical protein